MGSYVAQQVIKRLANHDLPLKKLRVGILGLTFKENVPDIRNSKVVDIIRELKSYGVEALIHDPLAHHEAVQEEFGIELSSLTEFRKLHALILAVPHDHYGHIQPASLNAMIVEHGLFVDVKSNVSPAAMRSDIDYWSL